MRVASSIALPIETRRRLEKQMRGRSTPVRVALRSRIVLLAADGLQNKQIAALMGVTPRMVALWRGRFIARGVNGLLKDAPRPGRTPAISSAVIEQVIAKTTQTTPAHATHWSTRTMAREVGISEASVRRIWRAHGLKPHRVATFQVSNDPAFADKLEAIVGLYLNPPEHALVLSADENSQIQALDRAQPGLPMKKGRGQTMTHDYKCNGTATLSAALDALEGQVISICDDRHRHQEWLKFLRMIDQTVAADKQVHIICDNYATHKHAEVRAWLEKNPRITLHFTPTGCSWINLVECFFSVITRQAIRRGSFTSVRQLTDTIGAFIDTWNDHPRPFAWTKDADEILGKIQRAKAKTGRLK